MSKYPFSIIQTKQAFIVVSDNGDQAWFYSRKKMAQYIADNFIMEKGNVHEISNYGTRNTVANDINKVVRRAYCKRRFEQD